MRVVKSAHVAERLLDDEYVLAAGASGPQDVFLAQRPSALRTLFLYWPSAERVAVVTGHTITILRPDLALSRCNAQESRNELAAGYELRRRATRRRADLGLRRACASRAAKPFSKCRLGR
jgi:hypothetical protein